MYEKGQCIDALKWKYLVNALTFFQQTSDKQLWLQMSFPDVERKITKIATWGGGKGGSYVKVYRLAGSQMCQTTRYGQITRKEAELGSDLMFDLLLFILHILKIKFEFLFWNCIVLCWVGTYVNGVSFWNHFTSKRKKEKKNVNNKTSISNIVMQPTHGKVYFSAWKELLFTYSLARLAEAISKWLHLFL